MSGIDTQEARKYWKNGKTECDYLDRIGFPSLEKGEREMFIVIPSDEEGNSETRLTYKATKHLIKKLREHCRFIDDVNKLSINDREKFYKPIFKILQVDEAWYVREQLEDGDMGEELEFRSEKEAWDFIKSDQTDVDATCHELDVVRVD